MSSEKGPSVDGIAVFKRARANVTRWCALGRPENDDWDALRRDLAMCLAMVDVYIDKMKNGVHTGQEEVP